MKYFTAILAVSCLAGATAHADEIAVTDKNYAEAESAWNFANWAKLGSDKKVFHYREVSPVGKKAPTVRMNWDTLYSNRIVKVSDDRTFTISLPETDVYLSAQVIDEDGFSPYYIVTPGDHEIQISTDYAWVLFRTGIPDRTSKKDLDAAHAAQDKISVTGMMDDSTYVMLDYNQDQLDKLRAEYKKEFLGSGDDFTFAKAQGQVDQHKLNLSHAAGWGGYPPELNVSNSYSSSKSLAGGTCLSINFPDPKNKFFTSFTLYDADGYLMQGDSYISSYVWSTDKDGTITLHFNCDGNVSNSLTSGGQAFSYTIRNYGASQVVLDGKFRPVAPTPVKK